MWTTYEWEIETEDSDLCGYRFYTELENADAIDHLKYAKELFPNEKLFAWGMLTRFEAEIEGLDTY